MYRRSNFYILSTIVIFLLVVYFLIQEVQKGDASENDMQISVISRDETGEVLETYRQGMEQAAMDMGAELSFVTLAHGQDVTEQIQRMKREKQNGADALILSAADFSLLLQTVETMTKEIPVVTVESPVFSKKVTQYVMENDWAMGYDIGENIIFQGINQKKILILEANLQCYNIARRKRGILGALSGKNCHVVMKQVGQTTFAKDFQTILQQEKPDVLVALEPSVLNASAKFLQHESGTKPKLYGIGISRKTPQYIEQNVIEAAAVQNNFNAGYFSVYQAMKMLGKKEKKFDLNGKIEYSLVHDYNMYSMKNQRLIFPFNP